MNKGCVSERILIGLVGSIIALPTALMTDASFLQSMGMSFGYGLAFLLIVLAFSPLVAIISASVIVSLIGTAGSGWGGASVFLSCMWLYGPFATLSVLGLVSNRIVKSRGVDRLLFGPSDEPNRRLD